MRPPGLPNTPVVATDPELDKDAKAPWKGIKAEGTVHSPYIYGTLLSKHLLPFGWQKLNMVALPAKRNEAANSNFWKTFWNSPWWAHHRSYTTWFEKMSDNLGRTQSKQLTGLTERMVQLSQQIDHAECHRPLSSIYGGSGTNIACCVLDIDYEELRIYGRRSGNLSLTPPVTICRPRLKLKRITSARSSTLSPSMSRYKAHQPEGLWGARHIHRTPFEACAIPIFDAGDPDHQELARLSIAAHDKIDEMKGMEENRLLNGGPGRARGRAREILADEISAIDKIVRRLLA